jgi:hypothetical protein
MADYNGAAKQIKTGLRTPMDKSSWLDGIS